MNLLIIDDDSISNFINTRVAEKTGLFKEIRSASNGKEALRIFMEVCNGTIAAPDVVLLDLHMPVMGGFDFMEALKGFSYPGKERLEIVVLTSSDHPVDINRAHSLGIQHYLMKSLSLRDLQNTIFSLYNRAQNLFRDKGHSDIHTALSC